MWRIYNIFHIFLLKWDTIKREQIDKKLANLDTNLKLDLKNDKKYKVESIKDNAIYVKKAQCQLLGLYYLIFYKRFPKEEDT